MQLPEQEFINAGISVKYKFKPANQDRQHLLVIFASFAVDYNFSGTALQGCRSSILWIRDEFAGDCTYYMCSSMDFSVERAVLTLIEKNLMELGLTRFQCTLLGISKGGSAALYYGMKYDFKNIIAACPQFYIGSYIAKGWPSSAKHMMGTVNENNIIKLNSILPNLLKSTNLRDKNIYLISSPDDEQYENEIAPNLHYFSGCSNFNFIFTRSSLVWTHNKLTRYNLPIIISIIHANGEGIYPSFGRISNGVPLIQNTASELVLSKQRESETGVAKLNSITMENGLLFPLGVAFIRGVPCSSYGMQHAYLILEDKENNNKLEFSLGRTIEKDISYQYFERVFCDYQAAGFASVGSRGIDISTLPCGSYHASIRIQAEAINIISPLTATRNINISMLIGTDEVYIKASEYGVNVHRQNIISKIPNISFQVENSWHKENKLHYEGIFAIKGIELKNWGDAVYYLTLKNEQNIYPFKIGMNHCASLNDIFGKDTAIIYQKAYFSTIAAKGVCLEGIPPGTYSVLISLSYKGSIFTQDTSDSIKIE